MTTSNDLAQRVAKNEARLDAYKSAASQLREEFDAFRDEVRTDVAAIRLDVHSVRLTIDSQAGAKERAVRMWIQLIASIAAIAVALIALLK